MASGQTQRHWTRTKSPHRDPPAHCGLAAKERLIQFKGRMRAGHLDIPAEEGIWICLTLYTKIKQFKDVHIASKLQNSQEKTGVNLCGPGLSSGALHLTKNTDTREKQMDWTFIKVNDCVSKDTVV